MKKQEADEPFIRSDYADNNQDEMMHGVERFENLQAEIDGTLYKGFNLFKKVYEAFSDIAGMTKEETIEAGLYPTIHYHNFAARKWMAEMNGGHLAALDKDYNGELREGEISIKHFRDLEFFGSIVSESG